MAKVKKIRPSTKKKRPPKKRTRTKSSSSLSLPTRPNSPPESLSESVNAIFGRKGIGKTSIASQFEKALVFMYERGRRNLKIHQVPEGGAGRLDWESTKEYLELFVESDFQTAIIDTVDRAYEACIAYICEKKGVKHPNACNDYGQTWAEIREEFDSVIGAVKDCGKGVVLISHEQLKPLNISSASLEREDDESDVTLYERLEPTCSKQAFGVIQEICDYVLYYGYTEGKRTITVRSPYDQHWVSCGITDTFLDPDGDPINTFVVGNDAKSAYKSLVDAYNNKLRDIHWEPPKKSRRKKRTSSKKG